MKLVQKQKNGKRTCEIHVDTTPYSVTTRKGGCEVWVSNDTWSYFIGECYEGTSDKTIATVMKHAQVICNALNENQMEQM
tara:strand:- start:146 stop:385 length:240 start_codon:yes stop_codon:yes gene_type:complete